MELDSNYSHFMKLYTKAVPALRAYLRQLLPGWEDVDEVLQETSLVLWKKFEKFEQGTDFKAWAFVIARLEVLNYRRKKARDRHVFSEDLLNILADEVEKKSTVLQQERKALKLCLNKLNPSQKEMTLSAYSGDKSIKEVAEKMDRSATALYKALNRVRTNLLKCIKSEVANS